MAVADEALRFWKAFDLPAAHRLFASAAETVAIMPDRGSTPDLAGDPDKKLHSHIRTGGIKNSDICRLTLYETTMNK
jgi:hypothetical protein